MVKLKTCFPDGSLEFQYVPGGSGPRDQHPIHPWAGSLCGASLAGSISQALSQRVAGGFQHVLGESTGRGPMGPLKVSPGLCPRCLSLSHVAPYRFTVIKHSHEQDSVSMNHHTWVCVGTSRRGMGRERTEGSVSWTHQGGQVQYGKAVKILNMDK